MVSGVFRLVNSACAGEEAIAEGLGRGSDNYLIQPFSAQELMSRVNAHLQRKWVL